MQKKIPVGILGATGIVGQRFIQMWSGPVVRGGVAGGIGPL